MPTESLAEVGDTERWQIAELGFAYVSNEASHADEVLDKVARFVEGTRPDLVILEIVRDDMDV